MRRRTIVPGGCWWPKNHVALAGRIAERLCDAGLAVDVVHGGSAAVRQASVTAQHWPAVAPLWATTRGLLATPGHRACVGIYPAWRAAHMPPTDALTAP